MLETLSNKPALADGVLDRKGNLDAIKMQSGRQAFLAKLQQIVSAPLPSKPEAPPLKAPLPADRPRGFAAAAQERINGALVRCEERYPSDGPHSVLYLVVDRDAAQWREKLASLHEDYFGAGKWDPLAPVRLEVVDRATDEALQRLMEAGLVARTTRAIRPLWPAGTAEATPPPLSDTERQQAAAQRQQAGRKLKMARLLGEGGLEEEARAALREALPPLARALAIEQAMLPPLALYWKEGMNPLREFFGNAMTPWKPVADSLAALCQAEG